MALSYPTAEILQIFDLEGEIQHLLGGRGLCYSVGNAVLRPSEDDQESQWTAELNNSLLNSSHYCVPRSIPTRDHPSVFVHKGWTASTFLTGKVDTRPDFAALIRTCRIFHDDIKRLNLEKPAFLTKRKNRWQEADLVVWQEKRLDEVEKLNNEFLEYFQPVIGKLFDLMTPLCQDIEQQVIHGDMTGNTLFQAGQLPGVIDMTPYWRPAQYAEAIIVADGLAWYREGKELVEFYNTGRFSLQLLVRALCWRCLTFAIDSDLAWIQEHINRSDYFAAAKLVHALVQQNS